TLQFRVGAPESNAAIRLTAITGVVKLVPERHELRADLTIAVQTGGARLVPLELLDSKSGLHLDAVRQGDVACRYSSVARHLFIEVARRAPLVTLSLSYSAVFDDEWDHIRPDDIIVRGERGWVPLIAGSTPSVALRIVHPAKYSIASNASVISSGV